MARRRPAHVVAGPGSQILVAQTAFLLARGRASVLAPTYSEHARAAELAGHNVVEVADVMQLAESRIAIVVNPNNPDGRIVAKDALLALADRLRRRGGLLLVDEAFMEVGPYGVSLADQVERGNIVVLRSFGKFYGLPGLRLSFAIAPPEIAARLAAASDLGRSAALRSPSAPRPLPIWRGGRRREGRLPRLWRGSMGCSPEPGSRLSVGRRCSAWCGRGRRLSSFSDWVRLAFWCGASPEHPAWLRFGLPGREADWQRLGAVLASRG